MALLVEVVVENDLPKNGTWKVPSLSAIDLLPVLYIMGKDDSVNWAEENVFRASKNEDGEIKIEYPIGTEDLDLLRFCIKRIIDSMIRAVLDTAWGMEVAMRFQKAKESGLIVPQVRAGGPLKL